MPAAPARAEAARFAAVKRWTAALDGVLPPPGVAGPHGAPPEMVADARAFARIARGGALRRSRDEARGLVARASGALPRGPRPCGGVPAPIQGAAALANLLGAALACGARLTLALLLALVSAPFVAAATVVRALGLVGGGEAPPVLDWSLTDAAQRRAFHGRLTTALQRKVPPQSARPAAPFATTQLGRDLARGTFDVAFRHAGSWRVLGPELGPGAGGEVEAQLRLLTRDDAPWQHQLAAVASQSLANGLLDALYDGVGWRRVGDCLYAPGVPVPSIAAAHFFQRRDAYHLRMERRQVAGRPAGNAIALTAELAWGPQASAQAWRNACAMERQGPPTTSRFAPAALRLQLGARLMRPSPDAPDVLRLADVRLQLEC